MEVKTAEKEGGKRKFKRGDVNQLLGLEVERKLAPGANLSRAADVSAVFPGDDKTGHPALPKLPCEVAPWTGVTVNATMTSEEVTAVQEIFVDFSLIGHACRFSSRVTAAARGELHPGDTVVVSGDGVAPARALVLSVTADDPVVEFELLDA